MSHHVDELTEKQSQVLAFIQRHMAEHATPPTRAEIAMALGLRSPNSAEQYLRTLQAKGHLEVTGQARGIRLHQRHWERRAAAHRIPIVGRVAAGLPILAEENLEDRFDLPAELFATVPDFLLRVRGESMRDAGILDGDLLAVRRAQDAENGQIVVARIEDEATVKRYRQEGPIVRLLSENADPAYRPIVVDLREQPLSIEGLALGVIGSRR